MKTFVIPGSPYTEITKAIGEPFLIETSYPKLLCPWGVTIVPLGDGVFTGSTTATGWSTTEKGYVFTAVVFRKRFNPVQLGEFYVADVRVDNHWFEIRRLHEEGP